MAVVEMKKCAVILHSADLDSVADDLLWLGTVEISPPEQLMARPEWNGAAQYTDISGELARADKELTAVSEAIDLLSKYQTEKKGLFTPKPSITRDDIGNGVMYAEARRVSDEVQNILSRKQDLKSEENKLLTQKVSLEPWESLDIPLSTSTTKHCGIVLGTIPSETSIDRFREMVWSSSNAEITDVGRSGNLTCLVVLYHEDDEYDMTSALSANSFSKISFKEINLTASEKMREINERLVGISNELKELEEKTAAFAKYLPELERYYDSSYAFKLKLLTKQKFLHTKSVSLIEGYVPAKKTQKLLEVLERYEHYLELSDPIPEEYESVPVMLENNKFASAFEPVVALYSYPAYKTFDPLNMMSFFYFLLFGLMLNDFVSGLILLVGCSLLLKLMNPKKGLRSYLKLFQMCGISTMICGVLFGGYLGDLPSAVAKNMLGYEGEVNLALLFDPIQNPMGFLAISLGAGVLHLVAGMIIKMYLIIKSGDVFGALADVGLWIVLFIGIGLAVLFPWGGYVALAAAAGIVLTQGRAEKNIIMKFLKGLLKLYDTVAYASDLVSYSGVLALSLPGAVAASVVNLMGTMGGGSIVGFLILIFAIAVGHSLNLVLNVLGSFVHTARLQYIEFFGKFYEDGGRPFKPEEIDTKYTNIIIKEAEKS